MLNVFSFYFNFMLLKVLNLFNKMFIINIKYLVLSLLFFFRLDFVFKETSGNLNGWIWQPYIPAERHTDANFPNAACARRIHFPYGAHDPILEMRREMAD